MKERVNERKEVQGGERLKQGKSSAGLQDGLIRLCQDLVADLGVGDRPVFLAQVKTQLALVAEVEVALLALWNKEEISRVLDSAGEFGWQLEREGLSGDGVGGPATGDSGSPFSSFDLGWLDGKAPRLREPPPSAGTLQEKQRKCCNELKPVNRQKAHKHRPPPGTLVAICKHALTHASILHLPSPSPVQVHEIPACISHVVHLQVGRSSEHPWDDARRQRQAGGVHEVEQQGDAGRVQGVRERHGHELLAAAATPLEQHTAGVQRVEEPAERRERETGIFKATSTAQCARRCTLPTTRVASVRMLRCRSSFRLSSTSLEWRGRELTCTTLMSNPPRLSVQSTTKDVEQGLHPQPPLALTNVCETRLEGGNSL
ncbi:hypothetical protein INR49_011884 [Caranx melampygus]|nr:hypothetical protein INR49_011884 [Caranx melampygus]